MNVVTNLALAGDLAGTARTPANAEHAGAGRDEQVPLVPISSLRAADSPRLTGESDEHVRMLAESHAVLPPITVHRGTMRVIDGMHRLSAARLRGQTEIEVRFADGDEDDVFVLAVQSNIRHGLPLTLSDRKAAAKRILASHPRWSDRKIASVTALSPSTLGSMRCRSTDRDGHSNTRLGQDGTDRPLSTAAARVLARNLLAERPNASVRDIATIAGIAPSTVHDVQRRLREGREPVPPSQRVSGERSPQARSSAGGAAPPLTRGRTELSLRDLTADPALRLTDAGRALLRLLTTESVLRQRAAQLAAIVPPHLAGSAAALARRTGDAWYDLASKLEQLLA